LRADLAVARAQAGSYTADVAALNELAKKISQECPDVAAHAPQGRELDEMEAETATVTIMAEFAPIRQQLADFVRVAAHLRWSSGKLTSLVHLLASRQAVLLLAPTDLCADWKGWVASSYSLLTPGAQSFLHAGHVLVAAYGDGDGEGEGLDEKVSRLLTAYEDREDRKLARAIDRLGHSESAKQMEAVGYATEGVLVTLGLQQRNSSQGGAAL
jgi:hypothetical protein